MSLARSPDTLAYVALVGLTFASYAASDALGAAALSPILAVATAKSALVGFQFMGLRAAHPVWRVAFTALVGGVVLAVWAARRLG